MKKYTYADWLNRVDDIRAEKQYFELMEWAKIRAKQKEIIDLEVEHQYKKLSVKFYRTLETFDNQKEFINSSISELKLLLFPIYSDELKLIPELVPFKEHCELIIKGGRLNLDVVTIPEFPQTDNELKYAQAAGYVKLYEYLLSIREEENDSEKVLNLDKPTTKQQILLIYYLNRLKILNLYKIHQDQTKQAKVLNFLINKNESNVYRELNKISKVGYKDQFFTIKNLKAILPICEELDLSDVKEEIEREIDGLELNSGKV